MSKEISHTARADLIDAIAPDCPVLIAGPTASGKSALALEIAARGGVIVNADASQVYRCWRVISARPSAEEEAQAPHRLYGHLPDHAPYSTGHWLREVEAILATGQRPVIIGGTGLYFQALNEGLADVPATPPQLRAHANTLSLATLIEGLDPETAAGLDLANRARVQRAWEVFHASGKGLSAWQSETPPPLLPLDSCTAIALDVDRDWLNARIAQRFDLMIAGGALDEVRAVAPQYDPRLPAHKAIGVPELMAHLRGEITLEEAREAAITATRRYAKRQRTWIRSKMNAWQKLKLPQ
ncbi:MAG: tRNA (adenosine(37)-N6)-dimethylallyltransferase MiaA [Sulfitobacter sp.]